MEIQDHLKFKSNLTDRDWETVAEIQQKIAKSSVVPDRLDSYIIPLLNLLHSGLSIDPVSFIDKVFFDFYVIRTNTEPHLKRIHKLLTEIGNYHEDTLDEQTHLVNIYRNIISDAFDPYLSLVVANLQFIEGGFTSIQQANLGLGERNKYEYAYSKLKPTTLFDGYNPVVRNAISHTGTDGIIYEQGRVVFRNIKRGTPSIISEVEVWTNNLLRERILQLMDFVHAIDGCIEIVGFDVSDIIKGNSQLSAKFFDEILTKDYRLEIHTDLEMQVDKILRFESKTYREKIQALAAILSIECKKRNLPFNGIEFNNDKKLVSIEVPIVPVDLNVDNEVIGRALTLIRYGIVAVFLFKFHYERFIIAETKNGEQDRMAVEMAGNDLEGYAKEENGLFDLLNDGSIFINGQKIEVTVDFEKLRDMEYRSLERRFPRKQAR